MFKGFLPLFATALVFLVGQNPLVAQKTRNPRAPTRIPVTIALVDDLPQAGAPFVIQRRPDVAPHDLILLRSDADADQLSEAVRTLLVIRQAGGDSAMSKATMRMRPKQQQKGQGQARRQFPWVQRVINDLRKAEPKEIVGIGTVPAVEIWLPPQRKRGKRSR